MPLPEATMRLGDLVAGGAGDVAVEDGDVVGVDAQQLQSGVAVAGDVGRDRFQAQPIADGLCHVGLVLDDQHTHSSGCYESAHIVSVSKAAYVPATRCCLDWWHDLQRTGTSNDPSDSRCPCRRPAGRRLGDRRCRRVPGAVVLDGRITHRRPSRWGRWASRWRPWASRCDTRGFDGGHRRALGEADGARPRRHDGLR